MMSVRMRMMRMITTMTMGMMTITMAMMMVVVMCCAVLGWDGMMHQYVLTRYEAAALFA